VGLRPGVTDSVADSLIRGAKTIGVTFHQAATARRCVFSGSLTPAELEQIAQELLCNEIIHIYCLGYLKPAFAPPAEASDLVKRVVLRGASDVELERLWPHQHPRWTRQEGGNLGLAIFENGVRYAQKQKLEGSSLPVKCC
jgi:phosphoribosylformylglycinamidine (FGAM) synthase PurS component